MNFEMYFDITSTALVIHLLSVCMSHPDVNSGWGYDCLPDRKAEVVSKVYPRLIQCFDNRWGPKNDTLIDCCHEFELITAMKTVSPVPVREAISENHHDCMTNYDIEVDKDFCDKQENMSSMGVPPGFGDDYNCYDLVYNYRTKYERNAD
ncbi:unnamed protein product, partial [Medioppia subpectinata]